MWNTQISNIHLRLAVASLIWTFLGLKDGIRAFPSPMSKAITGSGDVLQSTSSLLDDSVRLGRNVEPGSNAADNLRFGSSLSSTTPDGGQQVSDLRNVHQLEEVTDTENLKALKEGWNKDLEKPISKASDVESRERDQIVNFLKDPEMSTEFKNTLGNWEGKSKESNDLYKQLNQILASRNSPIPNQNSIDETIYSKLYNARLAATLQGKQFDEGLELVKQIKADPSLEGNSQLDQVVKKFEEAKKTSDEAYLEVLENPARFKESTNPNQAPQFPPSISEIISNGNTKNAKAKGIQDEITTTQIQRNALGFVKPHRGAEFLDGDIKSLHQRLESTTRKETEELQGYENARNKFIQSQNEAQEAHKLAYRDALMVFFDPKNGEQNPMVWQDYMRTKELVLQNQALKEGRVLTSEEARFAQEYNFISSVSASRETPLSSMIVANKKLQTAFGELERTNAARRLATTKPQGSRIINWLKKVFRLTPSKNQKPEVLQEPPRGPPTWLLASKPNKIDSNVV